MDGDWFNAVDGNVDGQPETKQFDLLDGAESGDE
jgi:hypothetical protein